MTDFALHIDFALYAAACFFSMTAVMYGSAMAARWLDAREAGAIVVLEPARGEGGGR